MRARPGAAAPGGRISEWDPSLRLIVQNQIYGSNCMDCRCLVRGGARSVGILSRKTDGPETRSSYGRAGTTFANGYACNAIGFAIAARRTGSCAAEP